MDGYALCADELSMGVGVTRCHLEEDELAAAAAAAAFNLSSLTR